MRNAEHHPPEAIEYTKEICRYLVETYGRFPAHTDAFHLPGIWVQFSHLEIEYYERFGNPGHARRAGRGPGDLGAPVMSTQVQTSVERTAGATPEKPPGNPIGRMTGLTLFTPVRRQWLPVQKAGFWLGKYVPLAQKHILQFDFIHFVRWTIVRELPHPDRPSERASTTRTCSSRATSTAPGSTTSTPSRTSSRRTSASSGAAASSFPTRRRPSR